MKWRKNMKKTKNNENSKKYVRSIIISTLAFVISAIFFVIVSFELVPFPSVLLRRIISAFVALVAAVSIALMIFSFSKWRSSTNSIRFDYNTFSLVDNINSERAFLAAVDKQIKKDKHSENALIVFNVTRFKKTVFTRYGYEKGAEVLSVVYESFNPLAKFYPQSVYGYDYNENFLIFLSKVDLEAVNKYIAELTKIINEKLNASKNEVKFASDFGVSFTNQDNVNDKVSTTALLQRALIAADHGRIENELGGTTVYDPKMFEKNKRNVQLGLEMEHGLELSQFKLHFQPKFDLKLGRFAGSEALVRWQHPELGLLSPASFILFAEQSDLIIKLDHYVIESVCKQLDEWRGQGGRLLPVSINISKRTLFTGNILNHIINVTEKYNINPMLLEIEIVESPSLQDILLLLSIVKKFKNLKIKIAIDDFGTGYSSLSYIKKIPFDVIKIDKAFLDDVDIDQKSRLVIKNIIDLAHILDATVVIEGVQDEKQVKMLKDMGADLIQGFFYSRPLAPEQFQLFLEDNLFEMKAKKERKKA